MNREETLALWRKCQEAKIKASESGELPQRAAMEVWNGWAEPLFHRAGRYSGANISSDLLVDFSFSLFSDAKNYRIRAGRSFFRISGGMIDFTGFLFPGVSFFTECIFDGFLNFAGARFEGMTYFDQSEFRKSSIFIGCRFVDGVSMNRATFNGELNSSNSFFMKSLSVSNSRLDGGVVFDDVVFNSVPDLSVSTFREAPKFDRVRIPTARFWPSNAKDRAAASYRALKRLAIASHDRDRELEFFAGEMRAARFVTDFPTLSHGLSAFGRFWIGMAYDVFSDFGRSVARPLAAWAAVALMCSVYYLSQAKGVDYTFLGLFRWAECRGVEDTQTSAPAEALHLAFRNGLIVLYSGDESTHRTYGCLYGYASPEAKTPYVPASVSAVSAIQKLFSLLFIFLAGLGLRNMLKMK